MTQDGEQPCASTRGEASDPPGQVGYVDLIVGTQFLISLRTTHGCFLQRVWDALHVEL